MTPTQMIKEFHLIQRKARKITGRPEKLACTPFTSEFHPIPPWLQQTRASKPQKASSQDNQSRCVKVPPTKWSGRSITRPQLYAMRNPGYVFLPRKGLCRAHAAQKRSELPRDARPALYEAWTHVILGHPHRKHILDYI